MVNMTTSNPQTLSDHIDRFIVDSGLAHDFVKGDANTMVHGEEGDYPSLAMLAKNAQANIELIVEQRLAGMVVRKYSFANTTELEVKHNLGTKYYETTIVNLAGDNVYAKTIYVNDNQFNISFTENEAGILLIKFFKFD